MKVNLNTCTGHSQGLVVARQDVACWPTTAGGIFVDGGAAIRFEDLDISPYEGVAGTLTNYKIKLYDNDLYACEGYLAEADAAYSQISRTMAVDSGSDLPNVGEVLTGATSGAVGTVLTSTSTGGDWGADSGTADITMGTCSGRFQDNEDLNGSVSGDNCCTINMPNSAAGVDLVQNGDFSVDTDPPPGWTAGNATLTTDAGGQVGNCCTVLRTGGTAQYGWQNVTLQVGKIYKLSTYVKSGTSGDEAWKIGVYDADAVGGGYFLLSGTSSGAWVQYTGIFVCTDASCSLVFIKNSATPGTMLFDEISLYEIADLGTDGCHVVSAKDGSTQNWTSKHATFDYNDPDGYKAEILIAK